MSKLLIAAVLTALLAGAGLASAQTHADGNRALGQASGQDTVHGSSAWTQSDTNGR